MNWWSKAKSKMATLRQAWNDGSPKITMQSIMELFSGRGELGNDLSEITYFTCLKTLSESVGKMPLYLMGEEKRRIGNHETSRLIQNSPNMIQTPAQLFTYFEYCRNHFGNAYGYINRKKGKNGKDGAIESIIPLDPRRVTIWIETGGEFFSRGYSYFYSDERTGKSYHFKPEEILHFKSWITEDSGLVGKSVREILFSSFEGIKASSKFLSDLYQHGLIANAFIKYTGDLSRESQNVLLDRIEEQARDKGRRMITLPMGFDIQKLDLTLTDSQFYELKKYSALQIAAAFGIQPIHLNDLEKSSYANASMQNLNFYTTTLLYILSGYEQEMNRKLLKLEELERGLGFKFNVSVILRGDPQQQADVIQKMLQGGVYSVNEARRLLDREPCENGDVHFVNGSYVKLQDIGKAYKGKGGDENVESNESDEGQRGNLYHRNDN